MNEKDNRYEIGDLQRPVGRRSACRGPLTSGIRDTSPRWSPDGRWLVFMRAIEKEASRSLLSSSCFEPTAGKRGR